MGSKIRFYVENSTRSESKYFNFEILDEELLEEFENNIGYESYYSVRLSNHKRPAVMDGYCSYDHRYFIDTNDKEVYKMAKTYLRTILKKWENRKISVEQLKELLSDQDRKSMKEYLERRGIFTKEINLNHECMYLHTFDPGKTMVKIKLHRETFYCVVDKNSSSVSLKVFKDLNKQYDCCLVFVKGDVCLWKDFFENIKEIEITQKGLRRWGSFF